MKTEQTDIKTLTHDALVEQFLNRGMKKYRADQVYEWVVRKGATSFKDMTNISKADRALLAAHFSISVPHIIRTEQSSDGTKKFLFGLKDRHTIESVLIPEDRRNTLCISSQVGCAQACRFCLTGSGGFRRNLEAFEIVDQVSAVERILSSSARTEPGPVSDDSGGSRPAGPFRYITNIVLMGMGEPLANFDNVLEALGIITSEKGLGFSPRRITLSTDGLVPEIDRLGKSGINVNLAVSLNASTDEIRDRIMPVNLRYPIKELLAACRRFPLDERRRITFEYVLLGGLNDAGEDAQRLSRLLRGIRCKINLIPFNPFPGSEFRRPDDETVRRFQMILLDQHYTAPVRESRGRDISAACGQLREQAALAGK